jgi:hypothetical protein
MSGHPRELRGITSITFDGITWKVEEATLESAVFNDHIKRKQTVSIRLVCERPFPEKA